jgi:hypothetical protein
MEQVAAYRASGLKAKVWAEANGVPLGTLGSWCAHYRRWQARLEGGAGAEPATTRPTGFVAARVATSASASSVRIELNAGAVGVELHWPLAHARELAVLLRELGR